MRGLRYLIVAAALAFTLPAQAAVGDPEVVVYRVTDVNPDNATTPFTCTPFSGVTESFRFVIRDGASNITSNTSFTIVHLGSGAVTTAPGPLGTAAIAATTTQIICNVRSGNLPLHMIRFNPLPGTEE